MTIEIRIGFLQAFPISSTHMVAKMAIKSFRTASNYVQILKTLKKPFKRLEEEGTLIASHDSKSEWHLTKVVRTTMQVVQGGAEVCRGNHKENMEEN